MDAVVRTGGKQYRVHEGSVLNVATMDVEPGTQVELRDVLLVIDAGKTTVGSPNVANAVVVVDVVEHGKGKKVINFKYKAKTRYRRKRGHRQGYTQLEVTQIRIGVAAAPRRRAAAAPAAEEAPVAAAPRRRAHAAATPETPVGAAPRRRTRAAATPTPEAPAAETTAPAPRRRRTTKAEG